MSIECPKSVEHSFAVSSLCTCPLTLRILNTSSELEVAFAFEVLPPADRLQGGPHSAAPSGECTWLGTTRLSKQWLKPGESSHLSLLVGMWAAGKYSLDGFRVAICAWKHAVPEARETGEEKTLEKMLSCPPPPARVLEVVDLSDIGNKHTVETDE